MTNRQYPEKGYYFCHELRDIFGKLHRTFHFFFVEFNLRKCWNCQTQDSSTVRSSLFFGFVELLTSFVWAFLSLLSFRSIIFLKAWKWCTIRELLWTVSYFKRKNIQVCLDKLSCLLQLFFAHKHGKSVLLSNLKYKLNKWKDLTMGTTMQFFGKINFNVTVNKTNLFARGETWRWSFQNVTWFT